jgi:hypothetical protein
MTMTAACSNFPPPRHHLVFLAAVASLAGRLEGLEPEVRSAVTQWVALGWPAVVRRQEPGTCAQTLSVGFPLALNRGRRRVGIEVGLEEVARVGSPPLLGKAAAAAPPSWQGPLRTLMAQARALEARGTWRRS